YSAQPWKCMTWKLSSAGESAFHLQNHFTSKTFVAKTNGTTCLVAQIPFAREASARPAWNFVKLPGGFYRIIDLRSGESLTASSTDIITLSSWKEAPEQQWELIVTDPSKLTM